MAQALATPWLLLSPSSAALLEALVPSPPFSPSTSPTLLSINFARVGGVEIPNNKRVEFSLQYIHGIGRTSARKIPCDLNMDNRRFNALAIRRLKEIQCYRGVRHIQGLPCRGQRTKNNCRTLKGKRVAIAGKKKAPR
ncbi:hypothetical protein CDL15_Pgr003870 [Punica granatum]|uniref:30S ribosomal protein S13, chloroplastic-like n=1 Tax=Punica granatum TaxID=22663 RepID=A0A218XUH4_PUNGR|nr:hypothetical protein CDL15_Pgr003870 [Punica granatum]